MILFFSRWDFDIIGDAREKLLGNLSNKYMNATLEGINSIIQNIKRRARGFRNKEYFKTMIYLVCGDLDYDAVIKTYSEVKK